MKTRTTLDIRVRYCECDPLNMAHHSVYPMWLEMARVELLREQGFSHAEGEKAGVFFVVARMSYRFHRPAHYDEVITVHIELKKTAGVKIEHVYRIQRGDQLLATAETTLACVDRAGKLRPVPPEVTPG